MSVSVSTPHPVAPPLLARLPFLNAVSLLFLVLIAVNYFSPFADLDWAWQVRTGERIVQTGQIRSPEVFSYTIAGKVVPDFEWLYEVILYLVWSGFGIGGLKLLRILLVPMPLLILGLRLRREGVGWHGIAIALLVAVAVVSPAWNLRPLYVTTIGLLLVSGWLHDHCNGRRPLTWWLPVVMLLWANLHPGVITGQGLLLGAIAWEWLNRWVKLNTPFDRTACWRLTLIGGLGLLATFISPSPIERLMYPFSEEVRHPVQRIFSEMQPLCWFLFVPPYTVGLAYVVAILTALVVLTRFRQFRLWEIALLAGTTLLGNLAFRSLQDWLLIMLALAVPHLARLPREVAVARRRLPPAVRWASRGSWFWRVVLRLDRSAAHLLRSPLFRFQWQWPVLAAVVLAALSLCPPISRRMPIQESARWPREALDWMEREGIAGNIFAPPDHGSYVVWRLPGRGRSYVDTRGFFFPGNLITDSHYLPLMEPGWQERLDRVLSYRTDYFLLETWGPRGELWRRLQPHVEKPLYLDDRTVLLSAAQVREASRFLTR